MPVHKQRETKDPIPELYGLGRLNKINKLQAAAEHEDARCCALYYAFYYALAGGDITGG
jgi:hypothetical protein